MKKFLALLLALSMIFVFVGCGDDSDKNEAPQNQAATTQPTENNTNGTVNQGTPTTPSTDNGTVDQGTAVPPATSGYPFEKGSVTDYVYTNTWANLKFDMMENGSWMEQNPSSSTDPTFPNISYGFIAQNVVSDTIFVGFEEITSENANMTEVEYLQKFTSKLKQLISESDEGSSFTFGGVCDRTIANATYKAIDATYIDAIASYNVRKLDNYFIIICVNCSASNLSEVLNGFQTVR